MSLKQFLSSAAALACVLAWSGLSPEAKAQTAPAAQTALDPIVIFVQA